MAPMLILCPVIYNIVSFFSFFRVGVMYFVVVCISVLLCILIVLVDLGKFNLLSCI